jgi:plasmid stabilization system protein ParE
VDKDNKYCINYTQLARYDMLEILMYISEELDAPRSAERILDKIESDLSRLRDNPYSAPISRDEYLASQGFRVLVSGKYLALYKANDDEREVMVYRIVYGKRNLDWLYS